MMETVQLQCGNCKQVMGIAAEHLGGQVKCPHCGSVVQTPGPTAPVAAAPLPAPAPEQRESIFAGPESSDSVLGEPAAPKLELPPAASSNSANAPSPSPAETVPHAEAPTPAAQAEFSQFKSRQVHSSGMLPLIALIFLVPYSICMTLFVIYLIFFGGRSSNTDPYEYLRDPLPASSKGGAQKVTINVPSYDRPLSAKLKTTLGNSIQIGDLLVKFEKVRMADGDLQLVMRAKNTSSNTEFEPISDAFVRKGTSKYAYLEPKAKSTNNVFGAYLGYHKDLAGKDEATGDGKLRPNQEKLVVLTTEPEAKSQVADIDRKGAEFLWRIQVRRGFVKVDGKNVSATAVIGVEFTAAEIEREKNG